LSYEETEFFTSKNLLFQIKVGIVLLNAYRADSYWLNRCFFLESKAILIQQEEITSIITIRYIDWITFGDVFTCCINLTILSILTLKPFEFYVCIFTTMIEDIADWCVCEKYFTVFL
jgi:hypothetical protein